MGRHKNIDTVDTMESSSQRGGDKELHRQDDQPEVQARTHDRHWKVDFLVRHSP